MLFMTYKSDSSSLLGWNVEIKRTAYVAIFIMYTIL